MITTADTPTNIDANAPVISCHSLFIPASLETVWQLHTSVDAWPTWQPAIDAAEQDADLGAQVQFHWSTYGMDITSTVYQLEAEKRIVWGGPSDGIFGIHAWTFDSTPGGVIVTSEESWSGAPVESNVDYLQGALDGSLVAWLQAMSAAAVASESGRTAQVI